MKRSQRQTRTLSALSFYSCSPPFEAGDEAEGDLAGEAEGELAGEAEGDLAGEVGIEMAGEPGDEVEGDFEDKIAGRYAVQHHGALAEGAV